MFQFTVLFMHCICEITKVKFSAQLVSVVSGYAGYAHAETSTLWYSTKCGG